MPLREAHKAVCSLHILNQQTGNQSPFALQPGSKSTSLLVAKQHAPRAFLEAALQEGELRLRSRSRPQEEFQALLNVCLLQGMQHCQRHALR